MPRKFYRAGIGRHHLGPHLQICATVSVPGMGLDREFKVTRQAAVNGNSQADGAGGGRRQSSLYRSGAGRLCF